MHKSLKMSRIICYSLSLKRLFSVSIKIISKHISVILFLVIQYARYEFFISYRADQIKQKGFALEARGCDLTALDFQQGRHHFQEKNG